jgi:hypothetical protein
MNTKEIEQTYGQKISLSEEKMHVFCLQDLQDPEHNIYLAKTKEDCIFLWRHHTAKLAGMAGMTTLQLAQLVDEKFPECHILTIHENDGSYKCTCSTGKPEEKIIIKRLTVWDVWTAITDHCRKLREKARMKNRFERLAKKYDSTLINFSEQPNDYYLVQFQGMESSILTKSVENAETQWRGAIALKNEETHITQEFFNIIKTLPYGPELQIKISTDHTSLRFQHHHVKFPFLRDAIAFLQRCPSELLFSQRTDELA